MKNWTRCSCLFLSLGLSLMSISPVAGGERHGKNQKLREWLSLMSQEDRAKYKAAKKEAMRSPDVKAAHEQRQKIDAEYRQLLHAEMLRIDPSIKPLLEKAEELQQRNDF